MRAVARLWRRSIQTRVVVSTIVLSALVILFMGFALLRSVSDGLTSNRQEAVVAEARSGFEYAQQEIDANVGASNEADSQSLNEIVDSLTGRRGGSRNFEVVLEGPLIADSAQRPVRASADIAPGSLPGDLTKRVVDEPGTFWSYTRLGTLDDSNSEPGIVVGSQIHIPRSGDTYAMYFLYSLEQQQATLDLVRKALLLGGPVMVLLVGAVAWIVSRQVITPIRLARRIAERYASGRLEQRIHVNGEDDIARLSTSFNQMAASLQNQIRRLEELSRVQQRFVSDVSHELRTPLTTVRMASEVIHDARAGFDPVTARSAELLEAALQRFEELLVDLLEISRFDAGFAHLDLDRLDLVAVAERAVEDPAVRRSGISVTVINDDGPAYVDADVRRIDRIVRNLVLNAVNYSQSDRIEVRVAHNDLSVGLAVRDFGVGLEPEETNLVFNRFWRADPARASGGTGLGLAISKEDAELHGGSLKAWGVKGSGSNFVLTIPKSRNAREVVGPIPLQPEVMA
ncbi:two-component system sensor histidine kinase MtrB [soil metagenome]